MSRMPLSLALCLIAFAYACADHKCPPPYMTFGDTCRLCPPGQTRERGMCVPIWDGGVDAGNLVHDEEDDELDGGLPESLDDGSSDEPMQQPPGTDSDSGSCSSPGSCQTDECTPSLCLHEGVCSESSDGPVCDCSGTGYRGANCETDIDECGETNACSSPDYPCAQTIGPGYTCQGQFADWPIPDAVTGSNVKPNYDIVTTAGVVIDKTTGLLWQRTLPAARLSPQPAYADCTGTRVSLGDTCSWTEAKAYCKQLALGGMGGWRLPTKIELESISDHTRSNPAIDPAFPNTPIDHFWTASPVRGTTSEIWRVFAGNGTTSGILTPAAAAVRCVRGTSATGTPERRYAIDPSSNTVTDTRTGLVWQRSIAPTKHRWAAAHAYCEGLGAGWRLPLLKELLTLVDPTRNFPAIDISAFPSTPGDAVFWSSTPLVGEAGFVAWYVSFLNGDSSGAADSELAVRCVR